jgi:hypothetical protein
MRTPPSSSHAEKTEGVGFPLNFAADDPVGAIPDLRLVINDFERNRARRQQRQQKKTPPPPPESPPPVPPGPDVEHHVDDYA